MRDCYSFHSKIYIFLISIETRNTYFIEALTRTAINTDVYIYVETRRKERSLDRLNVWNFAPERHAAFSFFLQN